MTEEKFYPYKCGYLVSPWEQVLDIMEIKNITQNQLSEEFGVSETKLNEMIQQKVPLTDDIIQHLENIFQIDKHFWERCERRYRKRLPRNIPKKTFMEEIAEKRGWNLEKRNCKKECLDLLIPKIMMRNDE